jgi:homoserine kinase type II
MSVYTNLSTKEVSKLLDEYNIGSLISYKGISDGITNTNYFLNTSKGEYVITIFEDITEAKAKKYLKLMNFFSNNGLCSPGIMLTKIGEVICTFKSKPCSIMERLTGKTITKTNLTLCKSIGNIVGNFHLVSKNYKNKINNSRDIKWVKESMKRVKPHISKDQYKLLSHSSKLFEKVFEMDLPKGVIHSDLFRDNVLAENNKVTGLIDYYYSFNGPLIYELAVIINDWCTNKDGTINATKYNGFLKSYNNVRRLTSEEKKYINKAMVAAGLRFYLSRLVDMIFPKVGEITHIKDPATFERIIENRISFK